MTPSCMLTAKAALQALWQGRQPVANYAMELQYLVADTVWNEAA